MTEFKGSGDDSFGLLAFFSHLFISLSVLLVIVALGGWFFTDNHELYGILIAAGGGGVFTGIGLAFINILMND